MGGLTRGGIGASGSGGLETTSRSGSVSFMGTGSAAKPKGVRGANSAYPERAEDFGPRRSVPFNLELDSDDDSIVRPNSDNVRVFEWRTPPARGVDFGSARGVW